MAQAGTVSAQITRAQAAARKGAVDEAKSLYQAVLDRFPANKRATAGLRALHGADTPTLPRALALYKRGDVNTALTMTSALAQTNDAPPAADDLRAACLRKLGRPLDALGVYRAALDTRPQEAGLWYNCGAVLVELGRLDDARSCLEMATKLAPDQTQHWTALAQCQDLRGHYGAAYHAVSQALARDPGDAAALNQLGVVLRNLGRPRPAQQAHEQALKHARDTVQRASAHNSLGIVAAALGHSDKAKDHYRQALGLEPDNTQARLNLTRLVPKSTSKSDIAHMQYLVQRPDMSLRDRSNLHFALFTALHITDPGADDTFDHLKRGNQLRHEAMQYDPGHDAVLFSAIKHRFADLPILTNTSDGPRPIFVVGLPRSGTTLTEQVLAQTPDTHGAGELTVVGAAAHDLLRRVTKHRTIGPTADDMADFAATLRRDLASFSAGSGVIIDKMPLNFRWIGPILAALPEARIVHVYRDPIETCWSNYKIAYAGDGNQFAYRLDDLVQYHTLYHDLMAFWRAHHSDRIYDLSYSDLTADLETHSRRLTDFCGLDWSADCLHPERGTGAVLTASAQQVRKPVYNGNTQSWRCYERHLDRLITGLKSTPQGASSLSKTQERG